jgi:hypothetical protein
VDFVEGGDKFLDGGLIGPFADGVGPQGDGERVVRKGGQGSGQCEDHAQNHSECENLFHSKPPVKIIRSAVFHAADFTIQILQNSVELVNNVLKEFFIKMLS